jgi:hypothetical protein
MVPLSRSKKDGVNGGQPACRAGAKGMTAGIKTGTLILPQTSVGFAGAPAISCRNAAIGIVSAEKHAFFGAVRNKILERASLDKTFLFL